MNRKIVSALLALVLCLALAVSVSAAPNERLVLDGAYLLSDSEETALTQKLADLGDTYNVQIVIATFDSLDGQSIDYFVEYFYDSNGLGYGPDRDGILLLVDMSIREFRILSNGTAAQAITMDAIYNITDSITPEMSDGDYADAFHRFVRECDYYLNGYVNGFPFDFGQSLLISLVIGIVAGVLVALVLKEQLKSVRKQDLANAYVKDGSMLITQSGDYFMYRNISRREKPRSNSSSGSSGSSRNVGGGRF